VRGALTFGTLVAFVEYLAKFFAADPGSLDEYTVMQQAMAAAERVFGLLDTKDFDADGNPERVPKPSRDDLRRAEPASVHAIAITFENVRFFLPPGRARTERPKSDDRRW